MAIGRLLGHLNRVTDSNNDPISGGKVYVYRAGTSTLATVYTTSDAGTALSNPVVADAAGLLAAIWADDTVAYDVHVKTAGEVSLQQIANVVPVGAVQDDEAEATATTADLIARARALGLQINGLMEVSQELGSTVTSGITGDSTTYVADQWSVNCQGPTVTGQRVASPFPSFPEIPYAIEVKTTVAKTTLAATDKVALLHTLEGYRASLLGFGTTRKKPLAVGFIVRPSIDQIGYLTVSNGDADRCYTKRFSAPANTDTLVRFSANEAIPGCPDGTWPAGGNNSLRVKFCFGCGADRQGSADEWNSANILAGSDVTNMGAVVDTTVRIGAVLLVPNDQLPTATDWALSFRPFAEELAACQRFYEKSFPYATAPATNVGTVNGDYEAYIATVAGANTNRGGSFRFQVPKRINPTMTVYNPAAANNNVRDVTASADCTVQGVTAGEKSFIITVTANASTAVGNRLGFHWVADARG